MRQLWWVFIVMSTAASLALAANDIYLTDVIKNPSYLRALTQLLKSAHNLPNWTKQVLKTSGNYVGTPATYSTIGGTRYELFHTCKPHDCSDSRLEVMFSPRGARAWGAFLESGRPIAYLGAPSPAQRAALMTSLRQ